jgi:hypothetical protein
MLACPRVTDDGLTHFKGMTQLEQLTLRGGFTDAGMKNLISLSELKRLHCATRQFNDRGQLHQPVVLDFVDVPLSDCGEYCADYSKLKFRIDKQALANAGFDLESLAISGGYRGVPMPDALDKLLRPYDLGWTTDANGVVLTTAAAADRAKQEVRELQRKLPNLKIVEVDW